MPIMVIISKSYKLIQASITKGSDKLQKKFMVPHFWGQKATKYKYFLDWFFFFLFYILGILLSQDWLCWFQHFNMQSSRVWGCAFCHVSLSASHFASVAYILFQIVRKPWCMSVFEPGKYSCSNKYLLLFLKVTHPLSWTRFLYFIIFSPS